MCRLTVLVVTIVCPFASALADKFLIDKIYHPYVQPLEKELEFRNIMEDNSRALLGNRSIYRLGYGQALNDQWFGELYVIGDANGERGFDIQSYEAEALWQITEQGEYAADWGLLLELSRSNSKDSFEASTALLIEREWGRWSGTANLYGIYEFGSDVRNKFSSALNLQARYRYSASFEPAIELYKGRTETGLGPAVLGSHKFGNGRNATWEAGLIFGVNNNTADRTLRLLFEYEF